MEGQLRAGRFSPVLKAQRLKGELVLPAWKAGGSVICILFYM